MDTQQFRDTLEARLESLSATDVADTEAKVVSDCCLETLWEKTPADKRQVLFLFAFDQALSLLQEAEDQNDEKDSRISELEDESDDTEE